MTPLESKASNGAGTAKTMKILSIETSCDETAVSILDATGTIKSPKFKVLGNALYSQVKLHAKYGGVFPNLAKREHAKNLPILLEEVLKEAKFTKKPSKKDPIPKHLEAEVRTILEREPECAEKIIKIGHKITRPKIDAIAVTFGPGLEPTLWVGITVAKALGAMWNIPVVPINHMEGHVVSVLFHKTEKSKRKNQKGKLEYPGLALLISGGHTELVIAKAPLSYKTVGQTRDDALGECYDKVARMLSLPYPGGPEIFKLAQKARERGYKETKWDLPKPMINSKDLDFSFSGLKTSVLYKIREHKKLKPKEKEELAKEFEDTVTEVILHKTKKAIEIYKPKSLIVGGGVIANPFIREKFTELQKKEFPKLSLHTPERELATDNSVMIGMAGFLRIKNNPKLLSSKKAIRADGTALLS